MRLELISGRELKLFVPPQDITIIEDDKYVINELQIKDCKDKIQLNTILDVKIDTVIEHFIIKKIIKKDDAFMLLSSELTKAYWSLLPLINLEYNTIKVHGFLHNVYFNRDNNELSLLYKHTLLYKEDMRVLFILLRKLHNYKTDYLLEHDYQMFLFVITEDNREIITHYEKGEYSLFPTTYKLHIKDYFNLKEDSYLNLVLYKDNRLNIQLSKLLSCDIPKDIELMSIPIIENEKFDKIFIKNLSEAYLLH